MQEKDISKISVSELCADAEINRSTFYNHYGSQYDVLEEMGYEMARQIGEFGQKHNEKTGWTLDRQVEEICLYLTANKTEARLILRNFSADSQIIECLFQNRIVNLPEYERSIHRYDEETQLLLKRFLINGIYSLVRCWLLEDIDKSPKEIGALALQWAQSGWMSF